MPVVHLFSNTALSKEVEDLQNGDLELDRLLEREGTFQIYSESSDDFASPSAVTVHQVSDYDNDEAEDLIVALPISNATYFLASGDIVESDLDDGQEDGLIDMMNILNRPNSYRLDGFTPTLSSSRTTSWEAIPARLNMCLLAEVENTTCWTYRNSKSMWIRATTRTTKRMESSRESKHRTPTHGCFKVYRI